MTDGVLMHMNNQRVGLVLKVVCLLMCGVMTKTLNKWILLVISMLNGTRTMQDH